MTVRPGRPEIVAVSAAPAVFTSVAVTVIVLAGPSEYCADVVSPGASP